jgi:glycosyltransferase involved in cell wall biosynthesis
MNNELVSVIIPNYNYGEFLSECIESVLNQDYEQIEVIVVDDGSTDSSREILRSYGDKIKVIEINNSGAPTARNFGLMNAKGRYIAYLDADDCWMKNKISTQIKRLHAMNSDLVYCKMTILDVATNQRTVSTESREGNFKNHFINHPGQTPFPPSTVLMTRELVAKAGIWDTNLKSPAEDFDYFRRCAKFTEFYLEDNALVLHRNHSKSLTAMSLSRYYADNRLALVKLFADEYPELGFLIRRKSWIKLNFSFAKSFLKAGYFFPAAGCILVIFLPINF